MRHHHPQGIIFILCLVSCVIVYIHTAVLHRRSLHAGFGELKNTAYTVAGQPRGVVFLAKGGLRAQTTPVTTCSSSNRTYHWVLAADGQAVHWQTRLVYHWYKKSKDELAREGNCDIGGFTRILQSGVSDDLMQEIPTYVVQALPEDGMPWFFHTQMKRQHALSQWASSVEISEPNVFILDPDYAFLRPLPNLMQGEMPASHHYTYIKPADPNMLSLLWKVMGRITPQETHKIPPIGPAPLFISMKDLQKVLPVWGTVMRKAAMDDQARWAWGWALEMWAFAIAMYQSGLHPVDLPSQLMAHVPYDRTPFDSNHHPYYMIHYTYGCHYNMTGKWLGRAPSDWSFNKRDYSLLPPPRNLPLPPLGSNNTLVAQLVSTINQATAEIPCWDEYAKSGKLAPCKVQGHWQEESGVW